MTLHSSGTAGCKGMMRFGWTPSSTRLLLGVKWVFFLFSRPHETYLKPPWRLPGVSCLEMAENQNSVVLPEEVLGSGDSEQSHVPKLSSLA